MSVKSEVRHRLLIAARDNFSLLNEESCSHLTLMQVKTSCQQNFTDSMQKAWTIWQKFAIFQDSIMPAERCS